MRLFLMPTDVLFFRSARPFVAGEDTVVQSIFPPTPETMQGMLRALIASCFAPTLEDAFKQDIVRELIGDRESYGRFRLTALTLGRLRGDRVERLFPAPAHLQRLPSEGDLVLLRPDTTLATRSDWVTNLPDGLWPLMLPDGSATLEQEPEPFERWLSEAELAACLSGKTEGIAGTPASDISVIEPRIGIGLQHARKTVEEGLLYQTAVVRMASGYGFVVDFELAEITRSTVSPVPPGQISAASELRRWLPLPDEGWAQLGGERRVIRYKVQPDPVDDVFTLPRANRVGQRPLLYLAAPTYFSAGWRPESWTSAFGPDPVAAAVPRIQLIGGLSLEPTSARGIPKTLRRCVPAGSVYFFDSPLTVSGPYSDYGGEIGYGYAIEGVW